MTSIDKLKRDREFLLKKIYELSGADPHNRVSPYATISKLGWDHEYIQKVLNYLADQMFIESKSIDGKYVITTYGIDSVEERENEKENDFELDYEYLDDVEEKIDKILEEISKLGHGQEIIFEEIESLKKSSSKLSKKDFYQLVIGKTFDLLANYGMSKELGQKLITTLTEFSPDKLLGGGI